MPDHGSPIAFASPDHLHGPADPRWIDDEGRCVLCGYTYWKREAERLQAVASLVAPESYRRAVAILADEAEAYLSAVGDEDDAAPRIRWAIRRTKEAGEGE